MDAKKTTKTLLTAAMMTGALAACNTGTDVKNINNAPTAAPDKKNDAPKKDVTVKKGNKTLYNDLVKDAEKRTGLNFNDKGPEIFGIGNEITVPMGTTLDDLLYGVYALDADGNEVEVSLEKSLITFLKAGSYQTYLVAVDADGNATLYPLNVTILPGATKTTPAAVVMPQENIQPEPMGYVDPGVGTPVVDSADTGITGGTENSTGSTGETTNPGTPDKEDDGPSKEEIEYQKALKKAKKALDEAQKNVEKAEAEVAKKEQALKKAEAALAAVIANEKATAEEIERAQANLAEKQNAYSAAETARVNAYNNYMSAVEEASNSPEFQAAVAAIEERNNSLIDAMGTATAALAQYDAAAAAVETAEAAVSEKEDAVNELKDKIEALQNDKDAKDQELSDLRDALVVKEQELNAAKDELATAKAAYDEAVASIQNSPEYQEAVAAVDSANNELLSAIATAANSAETVTDTKATLDEAEVKKAEAEQALAEKKAAADEADEALNEAIEAANAAKAAALEADANKEEAEKAVADAEAALAQAQQNKTQIEKDIADTTAAMEGYDQSIEDARSAYEAAVAAYNEAKNQVALGSVGFFREREDAQGATASIDDLLNTSIANAITHGLTDTGITNVGGEGDATSLENMKLAISYLYECNELRASDDHNSGADKEPLEVSDIMMLGAQVEANAASEDYNHISLFKGDWNGQNLANMYNDQDPYYAWYTKEKAVYDAGRSGTTGHYKIIANPDGSVLYRYEVTGLGVNSTGGDYGPNRKTWMQNFAKGSSYNAATYSVEEYENAFLEYYDRVMGAMNTAKEAMDAAKAAYVNSVNANTGMNDEEKARLISVAEAMFATTDSITDTAEQISRFTTLYDSAATAVENATNSLEENQAKLDTAVEGLTDTQKDAFNEFTANYRTMLELEAAMKNCETEDEYNALRQQYNDLVARTNTLRSENGLNNVSTLFAKVVVSENEKDNADTFIANLEDKINNLNSQKAELEAQLAGLQTQYGTDLLASGATAEQKAEIERLQAELDSVNGTIEGLEDTIDAGRQAVEDATTAANNAAAAYETARDAVTAADDAHTAAEAEETAAQTAADNAAAEYESAEDAYNNAKAALDEANADADAKKDAYDAAVANAENIASQINENVATAEEAVNTAQAKVDDATATYNYLVELESELDGDTTSIANTISEAKEDLANAETALESAQADLTNAQADADAKATVLDDANRAVDQAQADYDTAVQTANDLKAGLDAEVAQQKEAYDNAVEASNQAAQEVTLAEAAVTQAEAAHDAAVEAIPQAQAAVETATQEVAVANENLAAAEEIRDEKQAEYDAIKDGVAMPAPSIPIDNEPVIRPFEEAQPVVDDIGYNYEENVLVVQEVSVDLTTTAETPAKETPAETPAEETPAEAPAEEG